MKGKKKDVEQLKWFVSPRGLVMTAKRPKKLLLATV